MHAKYDMITKEDLAERLRQPGTRPVIIDLRPNYAASDEMIPHAVHHDPENVERWRNDYDRRTEMVLYCASPGEKVSREAARRLKHNRFEAVKVLSGGWFTWKTADHPTQKKAAKKKPSVRVVVGAVSCVSDPAAHLAFH